MKTRCIVALAAVLMVAGCQSGSASSGRSAGATHQKITVDDVPYNTQTAFDKDFPSVDKLTIDKATLPDGQTIYTFQFISGGKPTTATYGTFGDRIDKHNVAP